jgi:hypothetical protein
MVPVHLETFIAAPVDRRWIAGETAVANASSSR